MLRRCACTGAREVIRRSKWRAPPAIFRCSSKSASMSTSGSSSGNDTVSTPATRAPSSSHTLKTTVVPEDDVAVGVLGKAIAKLEKRLGAKQDSLMEQELKVVNEFARVAKTMDGHYQWDPSANLLPNFEELLEGEKEDGGISQVEGFLVKAQARTSSSIDSHISAIERLGSEISSHDAGNDDNAAVLADGSSREAAGLEEAVVRLAYLEAYLTILMKASNLGLMRKTFTVREAASFLNEMLVCDVKRRLQIQFNLFDRNGDGWLDEEEVERAVDAVTDPIQAAVGKLFPLVRALPKGARKAAGRPMRYVFWDVQELPVRRRCVFAWAEGKKQVGPDAWEISFEQFWEGSEQHFPQLKTVSKDFTSELICQRKLAHVTRKRRKRAAVYGFALFIATVVLDNMAANM